MRIRSFGIGVLFLAAAGCSASTDEDSSVVVTPADAPVAPEALGKTFGMKRQLVVFKSDSAPSDAAARIKKTGARVRKVVDDIGVVAVDADSTMTAKLKADPGVLAVGYEKIWKLPELRRGKRLPHYDKKAPPPDGFLWGAQWDQRRINVQEGWANVSAAKQEAVTVAVLDVGVAFNHPDLDGSLVYSAAFTEGTANGCADPFAGYPVYDHVVDLTQPTPNPCQTAARHVEDHGTHVAGTILGRGAVGIAGVGPNLKLAAYKVFDRYLLPPDETSAVPYEVLSAADSSLFAAIADAVDHHFPVVNMSLGGEVDVSDPDGRAEFEAWSRVANYATRHGTLLVAAAGNESLNTNGNIKGLPADAPAVVSVSATGVSKLNGPFYLPQTADDPNPAVFGPLTFPRTSDVPAFYTNYGRAVDVSAPGGDLGPTFNPTTGEGGEAQYLVVSSVPVFDPATPDLVQMTWAWFAGTSMASPHVAGVAAMIKAKHPQWGPGLIRLDLQLTAQRVGPSRFFGSGIVDAGRATR